MGRTKGSATWSSIPEDREALGGNPQTLAYGPEILIPWRDEPDKHNALKKIIHFLRQQYNDEQIQMCMNVCKVGGMTRDELLAEDADPATSVVTETAFGQASAVGTGEAYAREDHTHGTPAQASIDHGSIGGLADDDHAQYHNDARGDARYNTKNENIVGGYWRIPTGGEGVVQGTPVAVTISEPWGDDGARLVDIEVILWNEGQSLGAVRSFKCLINEVTEVLTLINTTTIMTENGGLAITVTPSISGGDLIVTIANGDSEDLFYKVRCKGDSTQGETFFKAAP